jgi:hypothetical protein
MCPSPLHRHASEASTPAPAACRRFGPEGSTPEVLFHPRGFSPPRWVPPLHPLRACCIPLPILGFAAFPCLALRSKTGPRDTFPRRRTYPSKNSPSTAAPRHRGPCAPCRSLRITAASRQGPLLESCSEVVGGSGAPASRPCSVIGSGTPRRRCRRREIRSFLGFVPLQGTLLATGASAPPSSRQPLGARRRFAAGKLRFAPPSGERHRRSGAATCGSTVDRRSDRGEDHAREAGPWVHRSARSEDRCCRGKPIAAGRSLLERGARAGNGRSRSGSHPRRIPSEVHRACGALHGPSALRRGGSLPFHRGGERRTSMPSKSIRS